MKKKGKTRETFLFVSGFDAKKQEEEVKENKCEIVGNQIEQDLEPANEMGKELAEKLNDVNDELSKPCATNNDDKGICSEEIAKVKSIENLDNQGRGFEFKTHNTVEK